MSKWFFNWQDVGSSMNLFGGRLGVMLNTGVGQAKGCWLRLQIGYLAFFFRSKNRKRYGAQIGIFNKDATCRRFFFYTGGVSK